jgi:hypothetical protein
MVTARDGEKTTFANQVTWTESKGKFYVGVERGGGEEIHNWVIVVVLWSLSVAWS